MIQTDLHYQNSLKKEDNVHGLHQGLYRWLKLREDNGNANQTFYFTSCQHVQDPNAKNIKSSLQELPHYKTNVK